MRNMLFWTHFVRRGLPEDDKCLRTNATLLNSTPKYRRIYHQDLRFGSNFGRDTAKTRARLTPHRLVRSFRESGL